VTSNTAVADGQAGTVVWWSHTGGRGGIVPDGGGQQVFVTWASLRGSDVRSLKPGQRVTFDTLPGPSGGQAVGVRIVES
jgi:CspA family cold shock protein